MSRMTEQIGRVLGGRYRLLAPIGRGASAQVFVADDVRLKRQVAVKVLHDALAEDQEFLRRFRTEAQAAAALNHPNVMAVYDWGQDDDDVPWIVTEYLGGGSLRGVLDRGHRLTPSQTLVVGLQAARGLEYAHRRGFVHRDVKPANLLFDDEGRLRIADFGLARALAEAAWTEPQGAVVGTARYASPEQAQGMALTGRADVYSLALVLVEAVTGEVPFATDTTLGTLMARIGTPLVVPEALGPLAAPLAAAGAAEPEERTDARAFAAGLARVATALPRPAPIPLAGASDDPAGDERDPTVLVGGSAPGADDLDVPAFVRAGAPAGGGVAAGGDGDEEDGDEAGAPGAADPGPDATLVVGAPPPPGPDVAAPPAARRPAAFVPGPTPGPADDPTGVVGAPPAGPPPVFDDADDEWDDEPPWDPRSPTGRRRRRWPRVVVAVLLVAALGAAVGLLVNDLTEATPSHAVPPVSGLSQQEATSTLRQLGWEVTVDRTRRDGTAAGDVLGTRPARGTDLVEGRSITLVVSQGATLVDLPPIERGMPRQEVEDALAFSGLEPRLDERFDEEVEEGLVIELVGDPPARIEKGTEVVVAVSLGPEPRVVPDDLAGRSEADAVAAVEELALVAEVRREASETVPEGEVVGTEPGAGTEVERGSTVVVVVSSGLPIVAVPDISDAESLGEAVDRIEGAGLVAGDVRGPAAGRPAGTAPGAGTEVRQGSEVDIILERPGPGGGGPGDGSD